MAMFSSKSNEEFMVMTPRKLITSAIVKFLLYDRRDSTNNDSPCSNSRRRDDVCADVDE